MKARLVRRYPKQMGCDEPMNFKDAAGREREGHVVADA
jgi:hypothetical protein